MLSRRSSFKNQTCPVLKKPDATLKPIEELRPAPTSLPQTQSTPIIQKSTSFSHQEYDHDLQPLPRAQPAKFAQRTNSIGYQDQGHDYGLRDHYPSSHTQSIKVTQRTNSIGNQQNGHELQPLSHTQSTKVIQKTYSIGPQGHDHDIQSTNGISHQDHGHDLQPPTHTQLTQVTQRTNSFNHQEYGHDLHPVTRPEAPKLTQRSNSTHGHDKQPLPHFHSTKVTQITNSVVGHHNNEHGSQLALPKKPGPIIEFPVSPDLDTIVVGEGITNSNHPQHKMVHLNGPNPFTCMGCKEYGAGPRFSCQQCNFELHDFCALAPPVLNAHPLHSQHKLLFNPKPGKGGILRSKCDVCSKPTKGYLFHCSACSYQLHPCCAMLSAKMKFPIHSHPLVILPASTNSILTGDPGDLPCAECKRKRSGQVYRCTVCDYYLHAVCAKNMVNGLHANGIKGLDKPTVLGVAAKIATHVVVGFMGGLIEGLGEGLGEAITQNFVKGRCNSARNSLYPGN